MRGQFSSSSRVQITAWVVALTSKGDVHMGTDSKSKMDTTSVMLKAVRGGMETPVSIRGNEGHFARHGRCSQTAPYGGGYGMTSWQEAQTPRNSPKAKDMPPIGRSRKEKSKLSITSETTTPI